jgi:DNA repair exonuclease SbcCD ATPase subunit
LDFFKKLHDGSLQNFTGEQRRETEEFIKNSIGTKEDFLMTILTTATNLEDLLESKPTARGQVLSRFMGLEFLKRKEEVAKEIYSSFSKSKLSNIYNSEQLKQDVDSYELKIVELNEEIDGFKKEVTEIEDSITKGKDYRDSMLKKKHSDIDKEIALLNPEKTQEQVTTLQTEKEGYLKKLSELKVVEPEQFYEEDKHDKVKEEYKNKFQSKIELDTKISEIEKLQSSVKGGIKCEHCGIELMNAAITQQKISDLDGLVVQKKVVEKLMGELSVKEKEFVETKRQFDEYEKNKLIKEKYDLSIESCNLKIVGLEDKLKRWEEVQDKIKMNDQIDNILIKADLKLDSYGKLLKEKNNQINSNEYNIKSNQEKITNNKGLIVKIKEEESKDKIYKMYMESYGKNGVGKIIMKTMMPIINSELQRLMEDSSYFKLEIRINDKSEVEFIQIDNSTGVEKLMVSGSGYEKTIASLALRSVLSKVCSLPKPNVVVFDEVFGKISNDNLEMVSEFFVKIKDYFDKIFLITHNPMISQWSDTTVKIHKENNVSNLL